MTAWLTYAVGGAALLGLGAAGVSLLLSPASTGAVWMAAAVAWAVQLLAFAALVAARDRGTAFLVGWGAGMALRFAAVGAVAFWVLRGSAMPAAPALLSLVGFLFVLVVLEPLFLKLNR